MLTQGIATSLIIEIFIRLINIMKIIDSSSLLLELVSKPIKIYLRSRKDTLRCIINLILSEDDVSIKADMEIQNNYSRKKNSLMNFVSNNLIENLSSDEDESEAEKWEPLPLEITRNQKICQNNKFSDIISTLVNIFGSPEEFVEHYKRMLAERSVSDQISNFSIENEIKNLELLKVKFGENYFQSCEVLIKDVKESIKMNKSIQQNSDYLNKKIYNEVINKFPTNFYSQDNEPILNTLIISDNFWPFKNNEVYSLKESLEDQNIFTITKINNSSNFKEDKKNIYENNSKNYLSSSGKKNCKKFLTKINEKIESYKKAYSELKPSRTLDYYSNLGFVDLDLLFENGNFQFRVTPLSAIIISLFSEDLIKFTKSNNNKINNFDKEEDEISEYYIFTVDFISDLLKSTQTEIRKRLNFWVSKGALKEIIHDTDNEENTFYLPNKKLAYNPLIFSLENINKNEILIIEEDIFNFEFISNDQNKLNLENAVNTLLKNSGPKNFEQLLKNLILSYKVNISEIKLKEILGKMTLEQKIFKEGEFFNVLIPTH